MKTVFVTKPVATQWFIVDAKDVVLGRLASKVAPVLMGKNSKSWAPHQDHRRQHHRHQRR